MYPDGADSNADHISYLFRLDPRLLERFPDSWIPDFEIEDCSRPTDDQIIAINRMARSGDVLKSHGHGPGSVVSCGLKCGFLTNWSRPRGLTDAVL
jgi:hypothetical protein